MPSPCRYAWSNPAHVCRDAFGNPRTGDKECSVESWAQMVDQRIDRLIEEAHARGQLASESSVPSLVEDRYLDRKLLAAGEH